MMCLLNTVNGLVTLQWIGIRQRAKSKESDACENQSNNSSRLCIITTLDVILFFIHCCKLHERIYE